MEIEINGQTINIPDGDKSISILNGLNLGGQAQTLNMNNIIATADLGTIAYMKDIFKRYMGSIAYSDAIMKLIQMALLQKVNSAVISNKEVVLEETKELNEFSEPEIHMLGTDEYTNVSSIEVESSMYENQPVYSTENEFDLATYSFNNSNEYENVSSVEFDSPLSNVEYYQQPVDFDVTGDYSANVSMTVDQNEEMPFYSEQENQIVSQIENPSSEKEEQSQYRTDPSQVSISNEKESTLAKLQRISSEGPIFVDEERIQDRNLNIYNSISLGKIEVKPLLNVNPEKPCEINTKKDCVLEMGKKKLDVLRNVCKNIGKYAKENAIKIKESIKCKYNKIHEINFSVSAIGETSRELASKIKEGSKRLAVKGIDTVISSNERIKDNLIKLKENLINQQVETPTYEEESVKVM